MKKILLSVLSVGVVGAVAFGATQAFFSDTETSTGNTFTAGEIDLLVDSTCHYYQLTGGTTEAPVYADVGCSYVDGNDQIDFGTWTESDLLEEKFFMFQDLKPGDWGENTISLHVVNNDSWGRMYLANVLDLENDCTEPELDVETNCASDTNGELDNFMSAILWLDQGTTPGFQCSVGGTSCTADPQEGDNVWQGATLEPLVTDSVDANFSLPFDGLLSSAYSAAIGTSNETTLNNAGLYLDGRMKGDSTYFIGAAWCMGTGNLADFGTAAFYCDGSSVDNSAQTDSLSGDLGFEVVQHRNNPNPF